MWPLRGYQTHYRPISKLEVDDKGDLDITKKNVHIFRVFVYASVILACSLDVNRWVRIGGLSIMPTSPPRSNGRIHQYVENGGASARARRAHILYPGRKTLDSETDASEG